MNSIHDTRCLTQLFKLSQVGILSVVLNATGGTGKTFLLNTLLAVVRTMADTKQVSLAVDSI